MKIGFDISQLAHPGGVATYTLNLTQHLIQIPSLSLIFFYSSLRKPYRGNLPNVKYYPLPPTIFEFIFNRARVVPIESFIGPIDIFHSSDWVQPPTKAKKITTYHDVVPLKYPAWSLPRIVEIHKRRLKLVEKEIDMVIAVSQSTKKDLLEVSHIPEEKIVVIYEAAGENFKPQPEKEIEQFKKKLSLPDEFVLAIGGLGPRRNLDRIKVAAKDYNLVIAGQTITHLLYEDLPLLYSAAKVLLYPSLYEGFGLPIIEAMACGLPVITSNTSSMPEVGDSAPLYVDPQNTADISDKLKQVWENEKLRINMIKKGAEQAQKFSWQRAAQETAKIYEEISQR